MNDRMVYSGRAVVSNLVNTGIMLICEATLEDGWVDVDLLSSNAPKKLHEEFLDFLVEWEKNYQVQSDFKVIVADMQTLFMDLRRWLEQLELGIRSEPGRNRLEMEKEIILELEKPILPSMAPLFGKLEETAKNISEDLQSLHRSYLRRQLHPLVLCSPFVYRVFQKPLGYAGDYEMVNMILNDPHQGGSLFAKILNHFFLNIAPCQAHRNRIKYLLKMIRQETQRIIPKGRKARIFNLGCGPAQEIQQFLIQDDLCEKSDITLVDFNDETLAYTGKILDDIRQRHGRGNSIQMTKKSVNQMLKDSFKPSETPEKEKYDLVYCAGLFDYLSDRICKRLMDIFYSMLAPGGLLIATNVDSSNPNRYAMEYLGEWHLVYRNQEQLAALKPDAAKDGEFSVRAEATGVNIFIEVRKPEND
jgi:extracellular factor (EF) 3-hydroxypalmitic acid methyl ester biosynthesis protein